MRSGLAICSLIWVSLQNVSCPPCCTFDSARIFYFSVERHLANGGISPQWDRVREAFEREMHHSQILDANEGMLSHRREWLALANAAATQNVHAFFEAIVQQQ